MLVVGRAARLARALLTRRTLQRATWRCADGVVVAVLVSVPGANVRRAGSYGGPARDTRLRLRPAAGHARRGPARAGRGGHGETAAPAADAEAGGPYPAPGRSGAPRARAGPRRPGPPGAPPSRERGGRAAGPGAPGRRGRRGGAAA